MDYYRTRNSALCSPQSFAANMTEGATKNCCLYAKEQPWLRLSILTVKHTASLKFIMYYLGGKGKKITLGLLGRWVTGKSGSSKKNINMGCEKYTAAWPAPQMWLRWKFLMMSIVKPYWADDQFLARNEAIRARMACWACNTKTQRTLIPVSDCTYFLKFSLVSTEKSTSSGPLASTNIFHTLTHSAATSWWACLLVVQKGAHVEAKHPSITLSCAFKDSYRL